MITAGFATYPNSHTPHPVLQGRGVIGRGSNVRKDASFFLLENCREPEARRHILNWTAETEKGLTSRRVDFTCERGQ